MRELKYAVIGTGAIGGYYGGRLSNIGKEVHFLYHTEYEWVKQHGLKVESVKGGFHLTNMNVYPSVEDMPQCDVVLVCLKSTQNDKLKDLLKPICHAGTVIVLVQNGIGVEAELAQHFPNHSIAGGMAFICAFREGKGFIRHADYGGLTVGFYQHPQEEVLQKMKQDFDEAEVSFYIAEDLNLARWRKLVWNVPYNGLTVALETTTDKLMQNPTSRCLVKELMEEVVKGANACGAAIEESFVEKMMESTDKMKPYSPSMKLDWDARRAMEIRAIYQNTVRLAKEKGVELKKIEMLGQLLQFKQDGYLL
jgi:2-dehydropantoate 2-reductase